MSRRVYCPPASAPLSLEPHGWRDPLRQDHSVSFSGILASVELYTRGWRYLILLCCRELDKIPRGEDSVMTGYGVTHGFPRPNLLSKFGVQQQANNPLNARLTTSSWQVTLLVSSRTFQHLGPGHSCCSSIAGVPSSRILCARFARVV